MKERVWYQPICRACGLLREHPTMERSITEAAIHRAAHYPDTPTVYGETDRHTLRETEKKADRETEKKADRETEKKAEKKS